MAPRRRQVVLVAFDGLQLLDLVGPAEVFDAATRLLGGRGGYDLVIATPNGRSARSASGLRIGADIALADVVAAGVDTLVVAGSLDVADAVRDRRLIEGVTRIAARARRTCGVCTGALVLATAGVLRHKQATTHWAFCPELARRFPDVRVEPDRIFVRDGNVATSAGVTAGLDLALALVEEDHGAELARTVARWIVVFLQRPGGQSQFSERQSFPATVSTPIRTLLDAIVADPAADHRQARLAVRAALSERHLRRLFLDETGTTPARAVQRVRVEAACQLLERSSAPVDAVATRCGFGSAETMRRAFHRVLGVGPADYRARFRSTLDTDAA